jgi:alpha-amylase
MKRTLTFILLFGIISGCAQQLSPSPEDTTVPNSNLAQTAVLTPFQTEKPVTTPVITQTSRPTSQSWWANAVFYEIFVRSFYDSNGDGIGDFNGIAEKLDYLQSLGVTALWLMPIYPSPSYHGYDVTDYYNVNTQYGTLDDFKNLLDQAHKRGMHIILDLVLNHTSDQNPWFIKSNNNISPYRDWYIWSDTNPSYPGPLGTAWFPGKQGFYYGIFGASMPDLNYRTPAVTVEMDKVTSFWLKDFGVDGFRLDAINYLIEEGQKQINTQSTHEWLKGFYKVYKADNPEAFTVGEVFGADATLAATYTGNQLDMIFNFEMASSFINSANGGTNSAINSALTFAEQAMPNWQFATFLTNHDQNRTLDALYESLDKARLAAFLLLTSPGTPFIYYGEEIGMEGEKPDPDIRRPMQWTADAKAGFTTGTPWEEFGPNYQSANVAVESGDPDSLLSFYKSLIAIRANSSVLRSGALTLMSTGNPGVYASLRYDSTGLFLTLANLTGQPITDYALAGGNPAIADGTYHSTYIFGSGSFSSGKVNGGKFSGYQPLAMLPAYGEYILDLTR